MRISFDPHKNSSPENRFSRGIRRLGKALLPAFLTVSLTAGLSLSTLADEGYEETPQEYHSPYYMAEVESNNWEGWPFGPAIESEAAIVMEYHTGAVLYAKSADKLMYPASITKIMTTLLACENNAMDKKVVVSENAVHNIDPESSSAYLSPGEELTMEQLLMAVMLQSANDAAYQAAEETSGSMKKFVELMNLRVRQYGLEGTHFNNPHGLHSPNHFTTAHDMAVIMRHAWANPRFSSFSGCVTYEIPPTNKFEETRYYLNNHKMMKTESYEYEGVLGGKTGFTDEAGNTLVTVARKGSLAVVVVTLNGAGAANTYSDTAALLDYAFASFRNHRIDMKVRENAPTTLFCDRFILKDHKWPALAKPITRAYITLPIDAAVKNTSFSSKPVTGSPCLNQIETDFYYNGQFIGDCFSVMQKLLPDLI